MNDLREVLGPDLITALEALIEEKVAAALADRENGSGPSWLTIEESAAYLKVSPSTIARRLKEGRLDSTYIGRRRLIRRADLDRQSGQSGQSGS